MALHLSTTEPPVADVPLVADAVQRVEVKVMGTVGHVVLLGAGAPPIGVVVARIEQLEAAWSRFRPGSELSRLGALGDRPALVSHPTALLLQRAVWAWQRTGGRFDPTVLHAVRAAGYDRDFDHLREPVTPGCAEPAPGCGGIEVDPSSDLVRLPPGVGIDPGGIGKGLAADLVATESIERGAHGAMVSIGGDLRVAGSPPAQGWEVALDHHVAEPARVNLLDGAVATSSTLRRRWPTTLGSAHHVIDPRTGRPSTGPVVACSVLAAEAWWAEALATALLVGWGEPGAERELVELLADAGALLTFADGDQRTVGPLADSFSPGRRP
jgi:thiamine biosynthesis lipoprotein